VSDWSNKKSKIVFLKLSFVSLFDNSEGLVRGFIKFLCRKSVGFYSWAILVFLMKESKKRR